MTMLISGLGMPENLGGPAAAAASVPDPETSVEGRQVPRAKVDKGAEEKQPTVERRDPVWPEPGSAAVDPPSNHRAVPVGDLPVKVASVKGAPEVGKVNVETLPAETVARLGGVGIAARFTSDTPAKVRAEFSYEGFRDAHGGNFASRLQVLRLPTCALANPRSRDCVVRPQPVKAHNDVKAGTLTAEIDADPGTGKAAALALPKSADGKGGASDARAAQAFAAGSVYVMAAGMTGPDGNFGATDLKPSGTWQAGTSGGGFSYDYPLPEAPSPVSTGPNLSLQYDASSVDGEGHWTNNQSGSVGVGWNLSAGFIERKYRRCTAWNEYDPETTDLIWYADENGPYGSAVCWESPDEMATDVTKDYTQSELVLNLAGRSASIVKDRTSGSWKTVPDLGWRIEQLTGGANGLEYWKVTSSDGQMHRFGFTKDAQWQLQYIGNQRGEPCSDRYFNDMIPPTCAGVWRWNLDQTVDANENVVDYTYERETNYFCMPGCDYELYRALPYDRGGILKQITYGHNTQATGSTPTARMTFTTSDRGGLDVPTDLTCGSTCTTNDAIAFYSTRKLSSLLTESRNPSSGEWEPATRLDFRHRWIYTRTDFGPAYDPVLWLDSIQQVGLVGGSPATLPPVAFEAAMVAGRMDYDNWSDWADFLSWRMVPRVAGIGNGMGGRIEVTYGQADPCGGGKGRDGTAYLTDATGDCYKVLYDENPEIGYESWGRFFKQLAMKVVERDLVGGSPDLVSSYDYLGSPRWTDPVAYTQPDLAPVGSDWRGYQTVRTTRGAGSDPNDYSVTSETFYRGIAGASISHFEGTVTDARALQGQLLQKQTWKLTSTSPRAFAEVESSRYEYEVRSSGTGPGVLDPAFVLQNRERSREQVTGGGWRYTDKKITYNADGLPAKVNDLGQDGVSTDNSCTATTYARNVAGGQYFTKLPSIVERRAGDDCVAGALYSKSVFLYDGGSDPATNAPSDGNVTETRLHPSATSISATKATFDAYGRTLTTTDGLNKVTSTTYDPPVGWPINGITTTNPAGHKVTTKYSHGTGLVTSVLDANKKLTEIEYDGLGRSVKLWGTGEPRSGETPTATVAYNIPVAGSTSQPNGPIKTVMRQLLSGTGSSAKYTESHAYEDGLGRVREVQTPSPHGGRIVAVTAYDARGLTSVKALPAYNSAAPGSGLLNPAFEALPQWTRTRYDGLNRPIASIDMNLAVEFRRTSTSYPGMDRVEVQPSVGGKVATVLDIAGRTVKKEEWLDSATHHDTTHVYSLAGNLTKLTDAKGNVRTFSYDWLDRRTGISASDSGNTSTGYDAAGRILWNIDGNNSKTSYTYDDLGRRKTQWAGEVNTGTKLAEWVYDTLALGQLTSSTRQVGSLSYTKAITGYDSSYRPTGSKVTIPPSETGIAGEYENSVTYDRAGNPVTRTLPAAGGLPAETLAYSFSDLGNPKGLTSDLNGGTVYVKDTSYSSTGRIAERLYGANSQVKRTFAWDPGTGWLSQLTTTANADTSNPVAAQNDVFSYNRAGEITRVLDTTSAAGSSPGQSECFGYDARSRLVSAFTTTRADCAGGSDGQGIDPYRHAYSYDAVGNLTSLTDGTETATYQYPTSGSSAVRPNAVTSITRPSRTDTYSYDNAGQLTSRTVNGKQTTFNWNQIGQLEKATIDGADTAMVYDADGERLIRREPGGTTLYLDGMEVRVAGSTKKATRYYGSPDGAVIGIRTTDGFQWAASGLHGSIQLTVDDGTGQVARERYLPYGQRRGVDDLPTTDRGFLGKTEDATTGLSYLSARYYDPTTAKFISPDPKFDTESPELTSPYGYAADNPVGLSDPDGLDVDAGGGSGSYVSAFEIIIGALPGDAVKAKFLERWKARAADHFKTYAEALKDDRLRTQQEFFLAMSICEEIGFSSCGKKATDFFFNGIWARHDLDELMGSDKGTAGGKASMFSRFRITPGKNLKLNVPSGSDGKSSYITYIIRNNKDQVVYVGKASGKGTPQQVLNGRFNKQRKGHDHHFPELGDKPPEIIDVYMTKDSMSGGEQFYMEAYREEGAALRNANEALSWDRPYRQKRSITKLDAFFLEKMFSQQIE
ncbi:RHS repeat-associated core domain-containing protein [Nonomuraea insulae]|uniref:RHS repeat-associated core domain-containing protein n=1 Tax=Nonomuraea insulae TaxID=1616787 RepID=A0ABW1CN79_9ACTN